MMSDFISYDFLVPPTGLIVLVALAVWATLWHPRLGISVALVAVSLLYLAALPVVAARMLEDVEVRPAEPPDFSGAQAIVVLGGGIHRGDGGKAPDTLSASSLERLDFAAHAYRKLGLPVAVTGGQIKGAHIGEATLMKAVLEDDFGVPVNWVEKQSRTTFENALNTQRLLQADNITTVVVVTNAWHMRRALWCFERVGLHAIPYPAPLTYAETDRADDYLPSTAALQDSYHALHEAIGLAYYRLRH
ncbi:MAG TPA: YdcF family protein [Stellaceae bacterium]|nr:YdcF family protein [Stellaceae bacterium]